MYTQRKVNILGTEYTIKMCHDSEDPRMVDADGFCDETTHEIFAETYNGESENPNSKRNLLIQSQKVVRHEIVHAFLHESGLAENSFWAQNEELVDWIAIQGPKIYKAWQEVGAM